VTTAATTYGFFPNAGLLHAILQHLPRVMKLVLQLTSTTSGNGIATDKQLRTIDLLQKSPLGCGLTQEQFPHGSAESLTNQLV
jgi:hypothetical protein